MVAAMTEPSLFREEEETVRAAEELLASKAAEDRPWPAHYRDLLDRYRKLLSQSQRLTNIGDLMQKELNRLNNEITRAKDEWERTFNTVPDPVMVLDRESRIVRANEATLQRLGLSREEVIGSPCFSVSHHSDSPLSYCPHARLLCDGKPHEAEIDEPFLGGIFLVSVNPVINSAGDRVGSVHVARDITRIRLAENQIRASLREKEVLLREIHHRVKNNFQMVADLLALQADQVSDERIAVAVKGAEARVHAMARVHEKLYQSDSLERIRMDEYLSELAEDLVIFRPRDKAKIALSTNIQPLEFTIDTAMPCGLIITELVTNAVKHAFPSYADGIIEIGLQKGGDNVYELMVRDNGVGFPPGFSLRESRSLGFTLVQAFAKRFSGEIAVEREQGTTVRIRFNRD